MAFPTPASNGQLYVSNGTTYIYLSQYSLWQKYSVATNTSTLSTNTATITTANITTSYTTNTATTNTAIINTANVGSISVSGNATFGNIIINAIFANGSFGTPGQILATDGTIDYWTSPSSFTGYTGSQGIAGYTGSIGVTGNQGYTGSQGIQGNFGYTGSKGDQGIIGYTGSIGVTGNQGYTGSQGIQGNIGYTGSQGVIGYTGSIGVTGNDGYTGSQGIQGNIGYTGSKGDTGYVGSQGDLGYTGSTGYQGSKGDQGVIGYTGSKGDAGYTGSQGIQGVDGYTGSQGDLGYTGSQGTTGYIGSKGDIGYSGSKGDIGYVGSKGDIGYAGSKGDLGYTGSKGDAGYTGSIGSKGDQGNIGYTGSQGNIGYSGSKGDLGYTGSKGDIGYVGSIGPQGPQGDFGGETVDYIFNTDTSNSDPGVGQVKFDTTDLSTTSYLYINQNDNYGANVYNFLLTIDASTSSIKGHFMVKDSANNADYSMFAIIGSHTYSYPYLSVPVTYLSGVTSFNASQNVIVTFAVTGDRGDIGYSGSKGDTGYIGSQGNIGYSGSKGDTGYQGSAGFTGSIGQGFNFLGEWDSGTTYYPYDVVTFSGESYVCITSATGYQPFYTFAWTKIAARGDIGFTGSVGFVGSQGNIGYTGSQGIIGYSGSKGEIGYSGSKGDTGYVGSKGDIGYIGSVGFTGSQGVIGYSGSKGDIGYSGSKGDVGYVGSQGNTGFVGSQGDIGYSGSKGDIGFSGSQGVIGYSGSKGDIGYIGSIGATGNQGYTGSQGYQGNQGFTGSMGSSGYTGSIGNTGDTGYTGSQGIQGNIGYTGSLGQTGATGYVGSIGATGDIGYTGSKGDQGIIGYTGSQGIQGISGYTGSQGIQGISGYTGSIGITGYVGSKGDKGDVGYTGSQGIQGAIGYTGSQGIQGVIGYSGSKGDIGYVGSQGIQGIQGTFGYTGSIGIGYTGSVGYVGSKGDAQQANVVFGDTPPSPTYTGLLWFDTNNAIFNAYYEPADSWIGINGGGFGPTGATGFTGSSGASVYQGYTGSQGIQANLNVVNTDIVPAANNVYNLGNTTVRWANVFADSMTLGSMSLNFKDTQGTYYQSLNLANQVLYITQTQITANAIPVYTANAGFGAGGVLLQNYSITLANTGHDLTIGSQTGQGNVRINTALVLTGTSLNSNVAVITILPASQNAAAQPFTNPGVSIYAMNFANNSNRFVMDTYGNSVYNSIAGRAARGTVSNPQGLQANDIILRISGNGYRTSGFGAQGSARIDFRSIDSFSDVQTGSQIDFWATPLGSNAIVEVATITAIGITSNSFTAGFGTSNSTVNSIAVSTNTVFTNYISANGSLGSPKQVLMSSDPTGNVYWQWTNQHFALGANLSLNATSTSVQSLFGVGVQVANNSRYAISMRGSMTYTGGGPAGGGNIGFGFGGTANLSSVYYQTSTLVNATETVSGSAADYQAFRLTSGFTANSSTNPVTNFNKSYLVFNLEGIINVANGGTLIPQYDTDHASTTLTLLALSSVSLELLGDDGKANSVTGTWA